MPDRAVESTCRTSPGPVEALRVPGRANPWTWIGSLFLVQAAGSVVVSRALGLVASDVAFPIAMLLVGATISFVLRSVDRNGRLGAWKWWLAPVIYGTFIFLLSNRAYQVSSVSFNGNYFHPLEYMSLGFLVCPAWQSMLKRDSTPTLFLAVIVSGVLFAVSDEVHQHFIPGRTMSLLDLGLDVLGLLVGFGAFLLFRRTWRMVAGP